MGNLSSTKRDQGRAKRRPTDDWTSNVTPRHPSEGVNLLDNPSFEVLSWEDQNICSKFKSHPWAIEDGKDGFILRKIPSGPEVPPVPCLIQHESHCISGSNKWSVRVQVVDLHAKGLKEIIKDDGTHVIRARNWFCCHTDSHGEAYMKVTLLNDKQEPIHECHYDSGIVKPCHMKWTKVEHQFDRYPPGVRYVKFEDGCKSSKEVTETQEGDAFAPKIAGTTMNVVPKWESGRFQSGNLLVNPCFTPQGSWQSDYSTTKINECNWRTSGSGPFPPFQLQQQKDGSGQYNPNDWCIATKAKSSREQIIDLTKFCCIDKLDSANQPRIIVNDQFATVAGHPGKYSLEASVLDKDDIEICTRCSNGNPSTTWEDCTISFKDYGAGVRALMFKEECSQDNELATDFTGVKIYHTSVQLFPGNLLKNGVFSPESKQRSSGMAHPGKLDVLPWKVLSKGALDVTIERADDGLEENCEAPSKYCIATTLEWFVRQQDIDLLEHGYDPSYIDTRRPTITGTEWFAARRQCTAIGYMKVSLLDTNLSEMGTQFYSGETKFSDHHWTKISFEFKEYPSGVRFIRFEDGGRGLDHCGHHSGTRITGAEVFVG